jgi:hypothetical protein
MSSQPSQQQQHDRRSSNEESVDQFSIQSNKIIDYSEEGDSDIQNNNDNNHTKIDNTRLKNYDGGGGGMVHVAEETKLVNRYRVIVMVVLLVSTIGVAFGVYLYISQTEVHQFEKSFHDDAQKVFESIGSSLEQMLGSIDILSATVVSTAHYTNQSWPFVTIPGFAIHAAKVRSASDGIGIFFQPLVTADERSQWEEYSIANHGWVIESMHLQEMDPNYFGPITYNFETHPFIYGVDGTIPFNETYVLYSIASRHILEQPLIL